MFLIIRLISCVHIQEFLRFFKSQETQNVTHRFSQVHLFILLPRLANDIQWPIADEVQILVPIGIVPGRTVRRATKFATGNLVVGPGKTSKPTLHINQYTSMKLPQISSNYIYTKHHKTDACHLMHNAISERLRTNMNQLNQASHPTARILDSTPHRSCPPHSSAHPDMHHGQVKYDET